MTNFFIRSKKQQHCAIQIPKSLWGESKKSRSRLKELGKCICNDLDNDKLVEI